MSDYRLDDSPQKQTNVSAKERICATCDGDRFVVVGTRAQAQTPWMKAHGIKPTGVPYEEVAPCPDCNSTANTFFHRSDGTPVWAPDSARTRELMER